MIRLIITDVDGTLVPEGVSILNPEYMDMIRRFHDKGVQFAVASGRQGNSLRTPFHDVLDLLYLLPDNGGTIKHGSQTIRSNYIKKEYACGILSDLSRIPDCHTIVSTAETSYTDSSDPEFLKLILENYKLGTQQVEDLLDYAEGCVKISSWYRAGSRVLYEQIHEKWQDTFSIAISGERWMDMNSPDTSKGNAVRWLQHKLGIFPEETVVFGDNFNDISMFHQAAFSYASEDSHPDVQKEARYLFPSYREDGVLQVLRHLLKEME